jgi:hypothetical protein
MHPHAHAHAYAHAHACMQTFTITLYSQLAMHTWGLLHTLTHAGAHAHARTHAYIHAQVDTYTRAHTRTHTRTPTCRCLQATLSIQDYVKRLVAVFAFFFALVGGPISYQTFDPFAQASLCRTEKWQHNSDRSGMLDA